MIFKYLIVAFAAIAASSSVAMAQPPQGGPPGGGHGGGPGGGPGGHPILGALDADQDHELSAEEIANASKALQALDKNGDGKLNEEDLGSMGPPGGGRGGPGGPPAGGQGGPGGPGGSAGGADTSDRVNDFASRLLAFDKNDDGKIEKDELPKRMQRVIGNLDQNGDNVLDQSELDDLKKSAKEGTTSDDRSQGRGGAEGGGRRGNRGNRGGGRQGMRGGPGGGGGASRMIEHAFEFDKDGDGKLSREELTEFANNMPQPGGQGGPPGGGPGGRGRPPGGRGR